ncbi:hypothetical protein [Sphingobium sp. CCH11-B1]|jgi:hypothetical protein|uniref:hypothetical protein n=1 Tax=Sphingobium sp. CCH11-B1 TaxID=1768781 RepID=UPI00082E05EB|nr:hypothetical protein [Sphingobium sp. CCH11-B1]MEA3389506.1 hypothetical protein [Pseudomonadota bacterium]
MRFAPALILPILLLAPGCSRSNDIYEELPNSSLAGAPRDEVPESRMDAPVSRPVTIGEDGPRLDACGALGQITRVGGQGLSLRSAPFADAKELARLEEGRRTWICTRSLDQKWLGVVVQPVPRVGPTDDAADCGVSTPVDRKQPYAGPCPSGWVSSAYVRLIAG